MSDAHAVVLADIERRALRLAKESLTQANMVGARELFTLADRVRIAREKATARA
jgi:hypothetical protein